MNILLVGGTGVISRSVTQALLAQGHRVFLLNRGHSAPPAGVVQLVGDIRDESAVKNVLGPQNFDVVADFVAYRAQDVERDLRLFGRRCGQYVFISSASAYQKPAPSPHITEQTPLENPYWAYSRAKAEAEALLFSCATGGCAVTAVRPSHTYCAGSLPLAVKGDKGPWSVVHRMLCGEPVLIHGDGTSLWTLTHADDFARGFVALCGRTEAFGQAFHITAEEAVSWNTIYTILAQALGVPLRAVHVSSEFLAEAGPQYDFRGRLLGDKAESVLFDNTKLRRLAPDFCCRVPVRQGLTESVQYLLAHPWLQVPDPDFDAFTRRVLAARAAALDAMGVC